MSELALKLIAENKKTRATFLDLGNCGLTEVPDEIGELVWLEGLSFASEWWDGKQSIKSQNTKQANHITQLSNCLSQLRRLKSLWLNRQKKLYDLSSLSGLSALQTLYISRTQIRDLTPLSDLRALQILDIHDTFIHDLTPLSNLRELQALYGYNTRIRDLTPLSTMIWLQELRVSNTQIRNLKPLSNLFKLQILDISNTQVSDLSPLWKVSWLQELRISNTQIRDLSPLSNLIELQRLNVSNTQVSDLSPLSNLSELKILDVSSTRIRYLNPLSNLKALCLLFASKTRVNNLSPLLNLNTLKMLDVSDTQVSDLSPLSNLSALESFTISNTKVSDLSILSNLRELRLLGISDTKISDLTPLSNLSKLKILDIRNTKIRDLTPLLNFFERNGDFFADNCPLTNPPESVVKQGNQAILNYFKEKQEQGSDHLYETKLLIVGTGGTGKTSLVRRLYQPEKPLPDENETTKGIDIHPHFFNHSNGHEFRLNVWDFGGQEIYHATHQFFLTQRSLYVLLDDTRTNDKTVHDPNFKYWLEVVDLLSNHSPVLIFQNEKGGRSKSIDLAGIKARFENVKDSYAGNLDHKNAADKLKKAIAFFAENLPHIGEELPAKWINIRAEIEQQAQQKPTISLDEYFSLYEKHLPFDESKALHLSRYLHDLGVFLHFQDDELLSQTVILQNTWATEAVFKILDDETVKAKLGRFTAEDCQRLWSDSIYKKMHLQLRALMEKFELCYLLQDSNPKTWLAPQLLPPSKPTELNDWAKAGDLVLRYRYEFLPKGMINRLMVRKHYYVPRPELAWLTGVLFERNGTQVLVKLSTQGNEIVFRARGIERKELLSIIAADLEALNATFKGLPEKVTVLIPCCCKQCKTKSIPATFERKKLLEKLEKGRNETYCPDSDEPVEIKQLLDGIQTKKLPNWSNEENMKKIFISYSKQDNQHKDKLLRFLAPLRDNDKIATWHDRDIQAGEEWDERIKQELNAADIVLYLVSVDSLATAYIQKIELPLIEQRSQAKQCKLVPVIVDFCDWEESWVAKYNALPAKGVPITHKDWTNENQAWLEVVNGIKAIITT